MSSWLSAVSQLDAACVDSFGQPIVYSRPQGPNLNAAGPFSIEAIADTSNEYASPNGPYAAALKFPASSLGVFPAKGDQVIPNFSQGNLVSGQPYFVQEIEPDVNTGWLIVKIRMARQ